MRNIRSRRFGSAAALLLIIVLTGGCMSQESKFVAHMEEKYGETFTYIRELRGRYNETGYTVEMESEKFPGEIVRVRQRKEEDGSITLMDSYAAYLYHEEAYQLLENVAGKVLNDFRLFFPVPLSAFHTGDLENYEAEDYLKEAGAEIKIVVIVYEDGSEKTAQKLAGLFSDERMTLTVTLIFVDPDTDRDLVTEENLSDYMAREGWFEHLASFWVRENREIGYMNWR